MQHRTSYNTEQLDSTRATINMVHNNVSLTVSQDEAARADDEAKRRLLASKKLSLVVDLDQTIIHATVDPTVGDWQKDDNNPNYPAVKDVRSFLLDDDAPGRPGCWYYIKLRPGLEEFLEKISKIYELHIYTMGTRAYAKNIADIIDPEHKIFGDRILSRTESGSMTAKNLQRLFPVDTKIVVIIDDRGDVWKWSPNLIKVTPYDFFVGIGDINSSFLPKKPALKQSPNAAAAATPNTNGAPTEGAKEETTEPQTNGTSGTKAEVVLVADPETSIVSNVSPLEQLVAMGGRDDQGLRDAQTSSQKETVEKQVEERPLLQKQKQLEAEDAATESSAAAAKEDGEASDEAPSQDESNEHEKPKHNLLQDDDRELYQLERSLRSVHTEFFNLYSNQLAAAAGGRLGQLCGVQKRKEPSPKSDLELVPDIKTVLPAVKAKVLAGVFIVFSGVIPLGLDVTSIELAVLAKSFGAQIDEDIKRSTTHLVAARTGTSKVNKAKKRKIMTVTTQWLMDSLASWTRKDEAEYLLEKDDGKLYSQNDDDPILSETEDSLASDDNAETDNNDSRRETPKPDLRIDVRGHPPSSEAGDTESEIDFEGVDRSPVCGSNQNWEEMNQELDDFLAEVSSEEEGGGDGGSVVSETNSVSSRTSIRGKKRGREDESGGESDQSNTPKAKKKKKPSFGNGLTSLSQTTNADSEDEDATELVNGQTSEPVNGDVAANAVVGEGEDEAEDDGWDLLAEQFQKEMEEAEAQSDEAAGEG